VHLFFRTRSREQRPVHERDGGLAGGVRNQRGKHAGVLVVHVIKSDAIVGMKGCKAESTPLEQIIGNGDCDSRTAARKRRVGHNVMLQRLDISDTRILASPAIPGQFVVGLRLQSYAHALDARRIARTVEQHTGNPDARKIAASNETRKEVKLPIPSPNCCRIEDALHFIRVADLGLHHRADAF